MAGVFALAMGMLSTVVSGICGWLLNRVFTEIDRLRQQDEKVAGQLAALIPLMVDRGSFDRHVEREERALDDLRNELKRMNEALQDLKLLLARNHMPTATGESHGR
jgi:hypothetical protein